MQVQLKPDHLGINGEASLKVGSPPSKVEWFLSLVVGLVVAAAIYGSIFSHYSNAPSGRFFSGAVQFDQQYYMVLARSVFDFGNGFVYSNPFSLHPTQFYYSHLFILAVGWLHHLTKIDSSVIFHSVGAVCTVTMFVSLFAFVSSIEQLKKWRIWMYLFCALSGGAGWVFALGQRFKDTMTGVPPMDFGDATLNSLLQRGEWLDSVAQSGIFANEAYYHTIMFTGLALLARNRIKSFALCLAVMWWSHPFYGVELTAIAACFVLINCLESPSKSFDILKKYAICAVPTVLGLGYYLGFLNTIAEHRDLVEYWKTINCKVTLKSYPAHYHVFLLLPPLLVLTGLTRARWLWRSHEGRLLSAMVTSVFALMNHNWIMVTTQPAHFSRGYLLVGLILLSFKLLQQLPATGLIGKVVRSNVFLAVWLLLTVPDNVINIYKWTYNLTGYHPNTTTATSWMPNQLDDVREYLNSKGEDAPLIVSKVEYQYMAQYLMRTTGARCYVSHVATPSFQEKVADVIRYMGGNYPGFVSRYHPSYLIMDEKDESHHAHDPQLQFVLRGTGFAFYEVLPQRNRGSR